MIIGISGKINSGKDTTSRLFFKNISPEAIKVTSGWDTTLFINNYEQFEWVLSTLVEGWEFKKFAYKLKEFAGLLIGQDVSKFEEREFKLSQLDAEWDKPVSEINPDTNEEISILQPMTVRDLLIAIGDGCRKTVHPNIWVNALLSDYNTDNNPKWIVNDLRYKNEAKALKRLAEQNNDQCFLIRINSDRVQIIDNDSETDLDDYTGFDFYIENNKDTSVEALENQVKDIIEKIKYSKVHSI